MIYMIIGAVLVVSLSLWGMAGGFKRKQDRPGPHNNWRKNTNTLQSSGWGESQFGVGPDGSNQSGGSGSGGGSD